MSPVAGASNPIDISRLTEAQATLLMPLWARACESRQPQPLLRDAKAEEIVSRLDFDFGRLERQKVASLEYCIRAAVLDQIEAGTFSPDDPDRYAELVGNLRQNDWFMVAADFGAYCEAQNQVDAAWQDRDAWLHSAVLNTAHMGWFSSDRTIRGYARAIWNAQSVY